MDNCEQRWQTFGLVRELLLAMAAHTVQGDETAETVVRIISARTATRQERRFYEDEDG